MRIHVHHLVMVLGSNYKHPLERLNENMIITLSKRLKAQGFQCVVNGQPTAEMIFCKIAPTLGNGQISERILFFF